MKKIFLFVIATVCTLCTFAQDTLLLSGPKEGYYSTYWPVSPGDTIVSQGVGARGTYYRYTKDTLTIYGIAASLVPETDDSPWYFADNTLENVFTSLRLYKRTPSQAVYQLGEELTVRFTEPPTFYLKLDCIRFLTYMLYTDNSVYPVYERYFTTPVTVTDSFYVGFDSPMIFCNDGVHFMQNTYGCVNGFVRDNGQCFFNLPNLLYLGGYWEGDTSASSWLYYPVEITNPYIFPILTPQDTTTVGGGFDIHGDSVIVCDTLIVGGDTIVSYDTLSIHDFVVSTDTVAVGDSLLVVTDTIVIGGDTIVVSDTLLSVMQPDMLQRLTGVMPSPARDRARVVSSIGLTGVEVYSTAGRWVHTLHLPAAPLSATLDVSRWPAGTYLLRITTPMGATMKKLTVTR